MWLAGLEAFCRFRWWCWTEANASTQTTVLCDHDTDVLMGACSRPLAATRGNASTGPEARGGVANRHDDEIETTLLGPRRQARALIGSLLRSERIADADSTNHLAVVHEREISGSRTRKPAFTVGRHLDRTMRTGTQKDGLESCTRHGASDWCAVALPPAARSPIRAVRVSSRSPCFLS